MVALQCLRPSAGMCRGQQRAQLRGRCSRPEGPMRPARWTALLVPDPDCPTTGQPHGRHQKRLPRPVPNVAAVGPGRDDLAVPQRKRPASRFVCVSAPVVVGQLQPARGRGVQQHSRVRVMLHDFVGHSALTARSARWCTAYSGWSAGRSTYSSRVKPVAGANDTVPSAQRAVSSS